MPLRQLVAGFALAVAALGSDEAGVRSEQIFETVTDSDGSLDPFATAATDEELEVEAGRPREAWGWGRRRRDRRRRRRSPLNLKNLGDSGCSRRRYGFCEACRGDCDSDAECQGDLRCFQRHGRQAVPGCIGGGDGDVSSTDFCYRAEKQRNEKPGVCTAAGHTCTGIGTKGKCGYHGDAFEWCYKKGGSWDYCGTSKCVGDPSITCRDISGEGYHWCSSHGHGSNPWERCCQPTPQPTPTPSCAKSSKGGKGGKGGKVYVVAHMTNTIRAVDWAVDQGANAVEADLQFNAGEEWHFFHNGWGGACDCTCNWLPSSEHVCSIHDACIGKTKAPTLLNHMAKQKLAMVFVDPKRDTFPNYHLAKRFKVDLGTKLAKMIVKELFEHGNQQYSGIAVLGGYSMLDIDMLEAAAVYIKGTKFKDRVYYSISMETRYDVKTVSKALSKISDYTIFADGITACWTGDYTHEMKMGAAEWGNGTLAMAPLMWTLDKVKSMETYLDAGARSLMTNMPKNALKAIENKGLTDELAKPWDRPGKARCR